MLYLMLYARAEIKIILSNNNYFQVLPTTLSSSLQDNYDVVLEACALQQDIKMLPGGDGTEIGATPDA